MFLRWERDPETMRAVRYHEHGGADVLQVDDVDQPTPGANELLIEVRAASVNPVDTYFREGVYKPASLPMIPGSDVAGEVVDVGDSVNEFESGDRVFATALGRNHQGTYAEYTIAPAGLVAPLPDGIGFDEAAGVALVGVTAWRALVDHAGLEPAESCLVHGGSGGVGHVAVQIAAATGARVVATASPDYHSRVAAIGADAVIDYNQADLETAVEDATEGGPDVVLDHRLDDYLQFDTDVAVRGARIVGIGNTTPEAGLTNVPGARSKELTVHLMSMFNTPDVSAVLRRLARLMADGDLTAEIDQIYSLADAADAQRAVVEESFVGKLIVEP